MCGIAGIISRDRVTNLGDILAGFSNALQHRGPDGVGFLSWSENQVLTVHKQSNKIADNTVGLIHRRLSIIDLREIADQPMISADGRWALAFNGEVYNHIELRKSLEAQGIAFHTNSDTEVLLTLLAQEGLGALSRVIGMYAFALLDCKKRQIILARDPFGIKPLHIATGANCLSFASEIRPLLPLPFVSNVADKKAVYLFLRHGLTDVDERTMFRDVHQIPAGHALTVSLTNPTHLDWQPIPSMTCQEEQKADLRALFERSVELHMRSDAPLSATLSGGMDSGAIVAAMARRKATPPTVFSYFADAGSPADETDYIHANAKASKAKLVSVSAKPENLAKEFDQLLEIQEQPFVSSSIWVQNLVFQRIHAEGYKVVLDGQGADELFAGYESFRAARLADLLRTMQFKKACRMLSQLPREDAKKIMKLSFAFLLPATLEEPIRRLAGYSLVPGYIDAEWVKRQDIDPRKIAPTYVRSPYLRNSLKESTYVTSLPMLLRYADRNAMSVSLENRTPYACMPLALAADRLPDTHMIAEDGTCKAALRQSFRGLVPDLVLNRHDKIGFSTPERAWFHHSSALRALLGETAKVKRPAILNATAMAMLEDASKGARAMDGATWRILNLLRWTQVFKIDLPS